MTNYDDSRLLDLLIDGDEAAIDALDPETRERLEALRTIRQEIRAIDAEDAIAFRPEQIEAAIADVSSAPSPLPEQRTATNKSPRGMKLSIGRLAWAAAILVGVLIAIFALGRGDRSTVYAEVFGKVDVHQDGKLLVRGADERFHLEPGMEVETEAGCWLNIGERFPCRAGRNTKIKVGSIADDEMHLELIRGMLRIDAPPTGPGTRAPRFIVNVGEATLISRGAVYSVRHIDKVEDHMIVDAGTVTLTCAGKSRDVTPSDGAFRYTRVCPCCPIEAKRLKIAYAAPICEKDDCRSFPVQRFRENAFEIARQHEIPVLVTRIDGPKIDQCFGGDFKGFVERARKLTGIVWLVLDPTDPVDGPYLSRIGVVNRNCAVILDHYEKLLVSNPINHDAEVCVVTLCRMLAKARVKCKGCPLR